MTKEQLEDKKDMELEHLLGKLKVTPLLLDLVRKVSRYTKVFKDLVKKRKTSQKKLQLSPTISALLNPKIPIKRKDPGSFTIPCMIGKVVVNGALLDLGAAINVMHKSVYDSLNMEGLKDTGLILQLADKSSRRPLGIVEDVLVKVKGLIIPADFYVLDTGSERATDYTIILGRPFLQTANVNISMKDRKITMEDGHEKITLTMYNSEQSDEFSVLGTQSIRAFEGDLGNTSKNQPREEDLELRTLLNLVPPNPTPHIPEIDLEDMNLSSLFDEEEEDLKTSKVKKKLAPKQNISKHKAVWQPVRHKTNPTIAPCYSISNFAEKEMGVAKKPRTLFSMCSCKNLA